MIKHIRLKRREITFLLLLGALCLLLILSSSIGLLLKLYLCIASVVLLGALALQLEVRRFATSNFLSASDQRQRLYAKVKCQVSQLEATMTLYQLLDPQYPFPPSRGWAASPDFLELIVCKIVESKPAIILEFGSGLSSVVIGYSIRKYCPDSRLVSVDHDQKYAGKTRNLLELHGLTEFVEVVHAPLAKCFAEERWYDINKIPQGSKFDMVVIDGPPANEFPLARRPFLPLFKDCLKKSAILIFDDTNRAGEQTFLKEYLEQYPSLSCEFLPVEKGAAILTFKMDSKSSH